jgi:hypothetical protein
METKTKSKKRQPLDPELVRRRNGKTIVFGVDLSLSKGIAYALSVNERIIKTGIEESISLIFRHVPENCNLIIAEKMFVNKNKKVALNLERAAGMLQMLCEENQIPFRQILGATWQQPIKKAFGLNSILPGMKQGEWENHRYRKFRIYLYGFLGNGLKNADLNKDEIAAACLALHGSRDLKKSKLLGLEDNGR